MKSSITKNLIAITIFFLGLASCEHTASSTRGSAPKEDLAASGEQVARASQKTQGPPLVSKPCSDAFRAAAQVSEYHDTHQDLFPAYFACKSIEEWKVANTMYPKAIDGVDPVLYARNVCAGNQAQLGSAPICQVVNTPKPPMPGTRQLEASKRTGLLGVPLPQGARLIERTPGDPLAGRDPSERYAIEADNQTVGDFFSRELSKSGWAKDGASTETALFFQRGKKMIGVIMSRKGGTFTLMGS